MMPAPLAVGIAGRTCAGKDTLVGRLSEMLVSDHSCEHLRFSDGLTQVMTALDVAETSHRYLLLTGVLKSLVGENVLSQIVQRRTLESKSEVVFWNGVRTQTDLAALRSFPRSILVYVNVDDAVAFDRFCRRGRNLGDADVPTAREFVRSLAPVEGELSLIRQRADVQIDGNGSVSEPVLDSVLALIKSRCDRAVSA